MIDLETKRGPDDDDEEEDELPPGCPDPQGVDVRKWLSGLDPK